MKRLKLAALVAIATVALSAVFAPSAFAHPSITSACTGCHSGSNVAVTATPISNNGVTAVYNVSAPTATALAVFKGSTKVGSSFVGTSHQFSVPSGSTYTIYAVLQTSKASGVGHTSVSPSKVVPDTTAPVTKSDTVASYVGTAAITLTATDAGGSGVAHTYYILDNGAQTEGTLVTTSNAKAAYNVTAVITLTATDNAGGSGVAATYYRLDNATRVAGTSITTNVLGTHTVEFWSEDLSGNLEAPHHFATFRVYPKATVYSLSKTPTAATLNYTRTSGKATFTLKAKLTRPSKVAVKGVKVILQQRATTTAAWTTAYTLTSSATGAVSKTITKTAKGTTYYRWHVVATVTHTGPSTTQQKVVIK